MMVIVKENHLFQMIMTKSTLDSQSDESYVDKEVRSRTSRKEEETL